MNASPIAKIFYYDCIEGVENKFELLVNPELKGEDFVQEI